MKIVVLDNNYPSDTNLYGDVFVHARVQAYIARGHQVEVIAFFTRGESYSFEGIQVTCVATIEELKARIAVIDPDIIAIHIFQGWMLKKLVAKARVPIVVWVHGREALGWYRRPFDLRLNRQLAPHILGNVLQLSRMHKLFRRAAVHSDRLAVVFVSEWIQRAALRDTCTNLPTSHVIPNPIDGDLFSYLPKTDDQRTKVLLIRSFNSRIYANDIAVRAILELKRHAAFDEFKFTIIGMGRLFAELTAPLRSLANVTIRETFLSRSNIRYLHLQNGVFLSPARQDTQGVARCEAMSSGLVPITSRNSAIPEFISESSGYLCTKASEMSEAMLELRNSPAQFQRMSLSAATVVRAKAAAAMVIARELALLQQMIN